LCVKLDTVTPLDGLVYRLVVAVDVEGYSKLDALDQSLVQSRLGEVLDVAAHNAGLDRSLWYRQVRGDGELAVLPADADTAWVVGHFTEQLATALRALRQAGTPLRMRLAMHCGTLTAGEFGLVGHAPIVTCRLLDSKVVRRALAIGDGDLVLVISQSLFDDVVRTRFHELDPSRFRATRFSTKGASYAGYLCAGGPRHGSWNP
jgi:class 3 adenylate cyclase